ncbi:hypothetical protein HSB1_38590 [Halogranum salarium B-1]|uniref:Uncharacterized protein n=1 Tax=Halogranum salarium B-1 TaxID=1210908 RepID=J3JDT7_9EURY|nr:hypothetical protein HSB1_38590 [Halogranum salarium B-1]
MVCKLGKDVTGKPTSLASSKTEIGIRYKTSIDRRMPFLYIVPTEL